MPANNLLGHYCTGYGPYPPRRCIEGEPRFTVNGKRVHLEGHVWAVHCAEKHCHDSVLSQVFACFTVAGQLIFRMGDPIACGSKVTEGEQRFIMGKYIADTLLNKDEFSLILNITS